MFIDFLVLMLLNMTCALFTIAFFLVYGMRADKPARWASPFLISGAIALACGLRLVWFWPMPGPYNAAFGEMSVLFGGLLLGAGISLAVGWSLLPLAAYGFIAGVAAVMTGAHIVNLQLTANPVLTGIGFVLTGAGGIFSGVPLGFPSNRLYRYVGAAVVVCAGLIWAATAFMAIPAHLANFAGYLPPGMKHF